MRKPVMRLVSVAVAASMVMSASVSAAAAAPITPQINPWQALSVLNGGASTIAFCGAAAAAQAPANCVLPQVDAPPPTAQPQPPIIDEPLPPPLPGAAAPFSVSPLILALGALAAAAVAYLLLKGKKSNSPN
ncbi:MAG: hypothetical protein ACREBK_05855 [Sphingomicrobium sp.]